MLVVDSFKGERRMTSARTIGNVGAVLACAVSLIWPLVSFAAVPDKPVGAEVAFVHSVQTTLSGLYPTPSAAEKAGYFRYTNVDETGAISYVNPSFWKS